MSIQILQVLLDIGLKVGCYSRLNMIYKLSYAYITKNSHQQRNIIHEIKSLKVKKSASIDDIGAYERTNFSLTLTQIVSIKQLLSKSGRVGSHCPRVWSEVFSLCKFVTDLENLIFRSSHSSLLSRARISISTILKSNSMSFNSSSSSSNIESIMPVDYYHNLYDFNEFKTLPGINEAELFNLESNFDNFIDKIHNKQCDLELKVNCKKLELVSNLLSYLAVERIGTIGRISLNVCIANLRKYCIEM